jgi:hypothetical protein
MNAQTSRNNGSRSSPQFIEIELHVFMAHQSSLFQKYRAAHRKRTTNQKTSSNGATAVGLYTTMGETIFRESLTLNANKKDDVHDTTSARKTKDSCHEQTIPERKNKTSVLIGPIFSFDKEEFPEEQGQEILWVENEAESSSTPNASADAGEATKLPTTQKIAQIVADGPKGHIIVLPEPMIDTVPREALELSVKVKDNVVSSESTLLVTAEKVAAAKQMLEQALNEKSVQRSSELSSKAFSLALEARSSAELQMNRSEEQTTILDDAITKGKAEVLKVQELNQQFNNNTWQSKAEHHASRARSLMDFILPENKVATPRVSLDGYKLLSNTKLETVDSSDAIFKHVARPKDFDVLSMSSLNEILDGPEEEVMTNTPAKMTTETPKEKRPQETSTNAEQADTVAINSKLGSTSCESMIHEHGTKIDEKNGDKRKHSSRGSGLFGGLFASRKSTREEKKRTRNTMSDTDAASLLSGKDGSCPEKQGHEVNNVNDPQVKVTIIEKRVQDIPIDDTNSNDSRKNVKIHFIQDSAANRTPAAPTLERMVQNGTEDSVSGILVAAAEVYPELQSNHCRVSLPTDNFLTIAGYKPILKNKKAKERYGQNKSKLRSPHKGECVIRSKKETDLCPNLLSSTADIMCDRYAVLPSDDFDAVEATNSFRTFLQSGDGKNIITLPGLDTISTLGTKSSCDQSPVRRRESSQPDKYQPEYKVASSGYETDQYHCHSARSQTMSQDGPRVLGAIESPSKMHHKTAIKASKLPTVEMMKLKREKSGKRLKRKSIAGLFGFGNANAFSNYTHSRSTPMNTPLIQKSEPPTKLKTFQTPFTEKGAKHVLPHYRMQGLPDTENESGNQLGTHYENRVINHKTEDGQAASHASGLLPHSLSKPAQTQTVVVTYPGSTKVFAQGLDKPTETDSTLSLCDDLEPEASHDAEEETRSEHAATEEDPLVAHLKKQIGRQPRRGMDPTSAKVSFRSNRLDP